MADIEDDPEVGTFDVNHDEGESDESETDYSPSSEGSPDSAPLGSPVEVEVSADAAVENVFDLPEASTITRYDQVIKHFG
jgi:hypothetical protein